MSDHGLILRQAALRDADSVAEIARKSRKRFLPYLPDLHTLEGDKKFYRNRVFPECQVWVFEDEQELVGFCAFREGWVDHLYLLPSHVGKTLGEALLNKAKENHRFLQLMVFQRNTRAISFYERNGFRKIKETDGSACEEKLPDALYEWHGPP